MGCSLRRESASVVRKRKPRITINQSSSNKSFAINARYNVHCVIEMPISARPKAHKYYVVIPWVLFIPGTLLGLLLAAGLSLAFMAQSVF